MTLGDRVAVMHQGVLQQVAPPMELYRRPVNRFVASFIGSPAMNFFPCTRGAGRSAMLECAGFSVELPGTLPADAPRELVLGVRPPDIALVARGDGDLTGRLDVIEPLGNEALMHVTASTSPDSEAIRVVGPADGGFEEGRDVELRFRPDRLHVFAQASGRRVE